VPVLGGRVVGPDADRVGGPAHHARQIGLGLVVLYAHSAAIEAFLVANARRPFVATATS
jgi:hypothetical protein